LSDEALAAIRRYDWPGNVRELKHCIERAALLAEHETIDAIDLALTDAGVATPSTRPSPGSLPEQLWDLIAGEGLSLGEAVARCEHVIIAAALDAEHGNRTRAADRLGIHLRTIFKKLKKA
jgi:DNA-binding NtrC family response regulator